MTAVQEFTLTFGGILRSEFIKLRTLRSTTWCYVILVAVNVGIGLLLAFSLEGSGVGGVDPQGLAVQVATLAIGFSQLVVVVLGALVITGEYGTGMIRTTFAAVPRRVPALLGKALVFGVVTFVVSAISLVLTALVTSPIQPVDFGDGEYWISLAGGAAYLALIGIFALALGAIIRSSAGGIAGALGAVLVLPTLVAIFASVSGSSLALNINSLLPSNAGARMYVYATQAVGEVDPVLILEPWQGGLVLVAWVTVVFAIALVTVKRRDV